MISKTEVSKALDGAFRAALMLTGSMQAAEHAVFNGIAATECYSAEDDALLLETVKAAIQRRPDSLHESQEPPAHLPLELRRLFLLTPISRDCFVLRILLGITTRTCSGILNLTIEEAHHALCAAFEALPFLELATQVGHDPFPSETGLSTTRCPNVMKQGSNSKGT